MTEAINAANAQPQKIENKKKLNPAVKGALVGGGICTGLNVLSVCVSRALDKDVFETVVKETGGKGKYFLRQAGDVAIWAGIGALINHFRHKDD